MANMRELKEEAEWNISIESSEMNLVQLLGLHPYPDGNMWCILWGEDLQNGVAGFGETPQLAVFDFNRNFRSQKLPTKG